MVGESCLFMHSFIKRALSIYHGTILAVKDNEDLVSALRLLVVQWKS